MTAFIDDVTEATMRGIHSNPTPVLLTLACLLAPGCQSGAPRSEIKTLAALPGISALEIDEVILRLKHDGGVDGLTLFVANLPVESAELRVGDRFALSNQRDHAQWYRVLLLSPDQAVLKREDVYDRRELQEGLRTTEEVVCVMPYDLEQRRGPVQPP